MDIAMAALLIPLAPFILGGLAIWTKHQRRTLEIQSQMAAERAGHSASQIRELEERVRVLERIVTDRGYDVAARIEALRDPARIEVDPAVAIGDRQ